MEHSTFVPKNHRKKIFIAVIAVIIYLSIWVLFDVQHLLTLETLTAHRNNLLSIVNQNYVCAVAVYICSLVLHSICALPATSLFFIAAGMLFGWYPGILYAWIGSLIGGYALFSLTRSYIGLALHRRYHTLLEPLKERIGEHAFTALIIMRSIPVVPFFLINISAGLAMVPRFIFASSLLIGSLPSICLYVFLGTELTRLSLFVALLQNPFLVLGCIILGCCLLYGMRILYRAQQQHTL